MTSDRVRRVGVGGGERVNARAKVGIRVMATIKVGKWEGKSEQTGK